MMRSAFNSTQGYVVLPDLLINMAVGFLPDLSTFFCWREVRGKTRDLHLFCTLPPKHTGLCGWNGYVHERIEGTVNVLPEIPKFLRRWTPEDPTDRILGST